MNVRTKLLAPHTSGCFAVRAVDNGDWPTPWAYLERIEKRISNGNKAAANQTGDRWWYARCNNPSCSAAVSINETDLLAGVTEEGT